MLYSVRLCVAGAVYFLVLVMMSACLSGCICVLLFVCLPGPVLITAGNLSLVSSSFCVSLSLLVSLDGIERIHALLSYQYC